MLPFNRSAHSLTSLISKSIGFSHNTGFLAATDFSINSICVLVADEIRMASMSGLEKISWSLLTAGTFKSVATLLANSELISYTQLN